MAALLCTPVTVSASSPDVSGSRDPYGIERYPRSWIVTYERDDEMAPRELVTSRVDRIRRDLRVDDQVQVEAMMEAVTYEAPAGVSVRELETHFLEQLGGDILFRCDGPGCGRSADWANQVLGLSILYGPDRNQRYAAIEWRGRLVGLYVIERGNKRVYAHLRFFEPADDGDLEANALLAQRLAERGWAVIEGARPAMDGEIGATARARLMELARSLDGLSGESVYLVCHLYGESGTARLLDASRTCAEEAAQIMAEGVEGADSSDVPRIESFGAGPFLPRSHPPAPRLELVVPETDPAG